jgi:hypothetical protein
MAVDTVPPVALELVTAFGADLACFHHSVIIRRWRGRRKLCRFQTGPLYAPNTLDTPSTIKPV